MEIKVVPLEERYLAEAIRIWNEVVEEGNAFPQEELLDEKTGREFFSSQTCVCVAADAGSDEVYGLYILHPNNIGRCGHIANASYAVRRDLRGRQIGEALVRDSLSRGAQHGFGILQFNAVVASNAPARQLYRSLGFTELGTIPKGFRGKDGRYQDIVLYYHPLSGEAPEGENPECVREIRRGNGP